MSGTSAVLQTGGISGRLVFDGVPGQCIALDVTDTAFESAGARLAGRLAMRRQKITTCKSKRLWLLLSATALGNRY